MAVQVKKPTVGRIILMSLALILAVLTIVGFTQDWISLQSNGISMKTLLDQSKVMKDVLKYVSMMQTFGILTIVCVLLAVIGMVVHNILGIKALRFIPLVIGLLAMAFSLATLVISWVQAIKLVKFYGGNISGGAYIGPWLIFFFGFSCGILALIDGAKKPKAPKAAAQE